MPRHLIEGLRRFRTETFPLYRDHYRALIEEGQKPRVLFIGCSDSRVVPDLLTGTGPGELFIVRNVGAFVPPFAPDGAFHGTAAGIEYAVLVLQVTDIVVCGHSHCGAVQSLYSPPNPDWPHLSRWLELGMEARLPDLERTAAEAGGATLDRDALYRTEQRSVTVQLGRLLTYPFVQERVEEGKLSLHGWHYVIEEGQILSLDVEREQFVPLADSIEE